MALLVEHRALLTECRTLLAAFDVLDELNDRNDKLVMFEISQDIWLFWWKVGLF